VFIEIEDLRDEPLHVHHTYGVGELAFEREDAVLAEVVGPAALLLLGERVALNFLMRLSGVATRTRRFVEAVQPHQAKIVDTRKTTPGWRVLEKYAVPAPPGDAR